MRDVISVLGHLRLTSPKKMSSELTYGTLNFVNIY